MPVAVSTKPVLRFNPRTPKTAKRKDPSWAISEIKAFVAIRDNLLAEAERSKAKAKLDTVSVANEFVETCLKPARPPYQAQCLPESDAVRERERCQAIRARIAELRAQTIS
jgi:hypothetical protein